MSLPVRADFMDEDLYLAGERSPARLYRAFTTGTMIRLETDDHLPATCDGRVAAFACVRDTWRESRSRLVYPTTTTKVRLHSPTCKVVTPHVTLLLASSLPDWCASVRHAVANTEFEIIGHKTTLADTINALCPLRPDILLLDLHMIPGDAFSALYTLKRANRETAVVLLTAAADRLPLADVVVGGASGYLSMDMPSHELLEALRAVCCGAIVVDKSGSSSAETC